MKKYYRIYFLFIAIGAVSLCYDMMLAKSAFSNDEETDLSSHTTTIDLRSNKRIVISESPPPIKLAFKEPTAEATTAPSPLVAEEGKKVDLHSDSAASVEPTTKQPVLKKIDITRIGAAPYYETFEGLRFAKYFTVAQRVEIFQEPKPIDTHILDAKAMRILSAGQTWDTPAHFRGQIIPQFTRAYGTEITMSDPSNPEGQIRYVHDYRDVYKQYFKYPTIDTERWDQNEIFLLHSKKIPGIDWYYTSNIGYRYTTINVKYDRPAVEVRHTYIANLALKPHERFEWFGEFEYYKSIRIRSDYHYRPDHYKYVTEFRMKSEDLKTSVTPSLSYSVDYYFPFKNRYEKYEMALRAGRDFTSKFNGTSTLKYVLGLRDEPDNTAPDYAAPHPFKDSAAWVGTENRVQYNIYDRLWLQGGLDYGAGTNMSDFDNWGLLAGLEYYAPGLIRVNVGWRGNHYYNIDDYLSSIYFKFYLYM